MIYLYYKSYHNSISIFPRSTLQSYWIGRTWRPGDFVMHLAGVSPEKRNILIDYILNQKNTPLGIYTVLSENTFAPVVMVVAIVLALFVVLCDKRMYKRFKT